MDIRTIKSYEAPPQRYVPKYAENRESGEPFAILHRPLIRGYQHEWLELTARGEERRKASEGSALELVAVLKEAEKEGTDFRKRFLAAHVVGADGLTDGGEPIGLDALLGLLADVPDLGGEVLAHVLFDGRLTEDDAKN